MNINEKIERCVEIENILIKANKIYDESGEDGILESEYNKLMQELEDINPNHELLNRIASPKVKSQGKVIHTKPMLSLEKVYSIEDLKKWMIKVSRNINEEFVVMIKFDGLAGRFENGVLSTRGDGFEGENITHRNYLIEFYGDEYDGELLITNNTFKNIVDNSLITRGDGENFKNSRNAVSGILRSDHEIVWNPSMPRPIQFIPYNFVSIYAKIDNIEDAINLIKKENNNYPTDGFVIKLKDEEYGKSLGFTSHHYKHSIALKEDTETIKTKLLDVEFQVAKEHIGMVGLLEPVDLGGVTISRVSLHNMDFIKDLNLKIGDDIIIKRAGEVIPHIVESLGGGNKEIECLECPNCGSNVILDVQFWKCTNEYCSEKIINKIVSSCKDLGIKGIAKSTIKKLYDFKRVENIIDLLSIDMLDLTISGWKDGKAVQNILKELDRVKKTPISISKILASLNISGFGESLFDKILQEKSFDTLNNLILHEDVEMISKISNMSNIRSHQLIDGYDSDFLVKLIDKFENIIYSNNEEKSDLMEQKQTICFTGKMPEKRAVLEDYAREFGFIPIDKVSSKLDILVVEDPNKKSTKFLKAKKLNIEIISRIDFYKRIGR